MTTLQEAAQNLRNAWANHTGAEPSESVLGCAIDEMLAALAQQGEPLRPDIIEKLSYHRHERDDMTLDDCLTYLQTGGWHKVHGRTERNMVLQLTDLLAAAPAPQPAQGVPERRAVR